MNRYQPFPFPIELGSVAIGQAVHMGLPAAYVYDLHVGAHLGLCARLMIQREFPANNPLAPHINIYVDYNLKPEEWYIQSGAVCIGHDGTWAP